MDSSTKIVYNLYIHFTVSVFEIAKPIQNLNDFKESRCRMTDTSRLPVIFEGTGKLKNGFFTPSLYHLRKNDLRYLHYHDVIEVSKCICGSGICYVGGEALPYREGDVQFFLPFQSHYNIADGDDTFWVSVTVDPAGIASPALTPDPDFLAKTLEKLHSIGVCRQKEMPAVYRLIDDSIRLMRTEQAKESPQAELLAAKLTELLLEISLTEKKAEPIKRTTKTEVILPAIHLVSDAIDAHRRLTVAELADACFLSESHFRKVFTAVIGESPKNYLIRTQTRKAAHLLISTETPIAEISCICGFDDTSTFYRRFLRIYGVSPSQYRAGHKK